MWRLLPQSGLQIPHRGHYSLLRAQLVSWFSLGCHGVLQRCAGKCLTTGSLEGGGELSSPQGKYSQRLSISRYQQKMHAMGSPGPYKLAPTHTSTLKNISILGQPQIYKTRIPEGGAQIMVFLRSKVKSGREPLN